MPEAAICWATCNKMVLLPTPGSPPRSTSEPGTTPPPSTRSSSPRPVEKRSSSVISIWAIGVGRVLATKAAARAALAVTGAVGATVSSTSVFHSLQSGQRPIHLACSAPQFWQTYLVLILAKVNPPLGTIHYTANIGSRARRRSDQPALFNLAIRKGAPP
ncbi:hypothetical protein D3C72_791020 [compost metagenome]